MGAPFLSDSPRSKASGCNPDTRGCISLHRTPFYLGQACSLVATNPCKICVVGSIPILSRLLSHASVAHLVEQVASNDQAAGSSPVRRTTFHHGLMRHNRSRDFIGQRGPSCSANGYKADVGWLHQTVNLDPSRGVVGSIPSVSTIFFGRIAQLVERSLDKRDVAGSSPAMTTTFYMDDRYGIGRNSKSLATRFDSGRPCGGVAQPGRAVA